MENKKSAGELWEETITHAYKTGCSDLHMEPHQPERGGSDLIVSLRKNHQLNFHQRIPSNLAQEFAEKALETSGLLFSKAPQESSRSWKPTPTGEPILLKISTTPRGTDIPMILLKFP